MIHRRFHCEFYWPHNNDDDDDDDDDTLVGTLERILLKHRQSVFPLFVGFVCSVIVVFCCCLFTSSVFSWQRLPSPCRCSPWISSRRSRSCGVLFVILSQRGFPATCWIHCCWVCCSLLFAWDIGWWFTGRKHCSSYEKPLFMNNRSFVIDCNRLPGNP